MAGSLKYFEYTADNGDIFALLADESNVEALNGTTNDYDADSTVLYHLPGNVKPRYAVFSNAAKTRNIKVPVLTSAGYTALVGSSTSIGDPIAGTGTLALTRLVPEKISLLPIAADTGLIDGDAT
jgi:hypothetical protein